MDRLLVAKDIHTAEEKPEEGEEVFVVVVDRGVIECVYSGGKFWPDHFYTLEKSEILFWTRQIEPEE